MDTHHPSIHLLYLLNEIHRSQGAGAYPSCHWVRGRVHPRLFASSPQNHIETDVTMRAHTHSWGQLRITNNLRAFFLLCISQLLSYFNCKNSWLLLQNPCTKCPETSTASYSMFHLKPYCAGEQSESHEKGMPVLTVSETSAYLFSRNATHSLRILSTF